MKYCDEFSIDTFPFWGGAKEVIDTVHKHGKLDDLQDLLEEMYNESVPTKTEINDFVWFNKQSILENLDIADDDI